MRQPAIHPGLHQAGVRYGIRGVDVAGIERVLARSAGEQHEARVA